MRTRTAPAALAAVLSVVAVTLAAEPEPPSPIAPSSATPATTRVSYRPATRPIDAVDRVLIISIDGLRPDLLTRADVPNLRALMRGGSFTMWARTTAVSRTLPSHVSMLTGVPPHRHEIEWNRDLPLKKAVFPKGRTLFDIAKQYGYTTALAAGKTKFDTFERPGSVDWSWIVPPTTKPVATKPAKEEGDDLEKDEWPDDKAKVGRTSVTDAEVAGRAVRMIREHRPQVMLVHLPYVDFIGHTIGWGTPEQIRAVGQADTAVGHLLYALD
ncbi:MAG TPA: alkaline phosphatase family protein, partial [Tepidisphaeraceae bacterium]|nr:alkaline phosphatase family protein [Tepidisphaeraceae bacterium]